MGKYVWEIDQKYDMMWVKLIHNVYLRNENWWEYKTPVHAIWVWKSIWKVKDILKEGSTVHQWGQNARPYKITEVYKWLKGDLPKTQWHRWVWNRFTQTFLCWLVSFLG